MTSKRSWVLIGIFVVFAVLMIVDLALFQGLWLDSLYPGANSLLNVLIIALIPVLLASYLLDRRSGPQLPPPEPRRTLPNGTRSGSGEPLTRPRPQPRIRRDKRAAQLETIVVEPTAARNSAAPRAAPSQHASSSSESEPSSARFLRSRRSQPA